MVWQKCPVCNATGVDPNVNTCGETFPVCPVCGGNKIISMISGLPPAYGIESGKTDFYLKRIMDESNNDNEKIKENFSNKITHTND